MKLVVLGTAIGAFLLLAGCAGNPKVQQADPNYGKQLEAMERIADKQLQASVAYANACSGDPNPGLCVAFVSQANGNNAANTLANLPAPPQQQMSFGQQIGLRVLDGVFGIAKIAAPLHYNYKIADSNNQTQLGITQSNNAMLSGIVTSGYTASQNIGVAAINGLTTVGSAPTTQVNGDYIVGNGNVTGDGNTVGDGNVDGTGNVVGDNNGDGDRFEGNSGLINQGDDNRFESSGPFDFDCLAGDGAGTNDGNGGNCQNGG